MFCHKCGKELPDDAVFCPKCGARRKESSDKVAEPVYEVYEEAPVDAGTSSKSGRSKIILFVLIGVLALAGGVGAGYYFYNNYRSAGVETVTETAGESSRDDAAKEPETEVANETETEPETVDSEPEYVTIGRNESSDDDRDAEETESVEEVEEVSPFADIKAGDTVSFGNYEQDGNEGNGKEEIEWEVLDVNENGALLISKNVLDCVPYNTDYKGVTWETCSLRNWLNGEFYDEAFSETEKDFIRTSLLVNDNNQLWSTNGGNSTNDKVFCLSVSEIRKYFTFNNWYSNDQMGYCQDLLAECTSYAMENNNGSLWTYTFGKSFRNEASSWTHGSGLAYSDDVIGKSVSAWWLRSPGRNKHQACYVGGHGDAGAGCDREVTNDDFGVRPAIWINTK